MHVSISFSTYWKCGTVILAVWMHLSVPCWQEYKIDFYYRRMLIQQGHNRTSGTVVDCSHAVTAP